LKYFLAVAQGESVNRAAEKINVSAGSLSKAISRLEAELNTPLFFKSGRRIRLTPEGHHLKKRAASIVALEEDVKLELKGHRVGSVNVYISASEVLHSSFGVNLAKRINTLVPHARIQFLLRSESESIQQVAEGEAHLAIITQSPPKNMASKVLQNIEFKTCASSAHPLLKNKSSRRKIPVEELLDFPFATLEPGLLGKIARSNSNDGWRDDKLSRNIKYKACGLKLTENLVQSGLALAYLPEYIIEASDLKALNVSNCPFSCKQTVRILAKDPAELSWLNLLWDRI